MSARQLVLFFCLFVGSSIALDCYMGERGVDWHEGPCKNGETLCYKTITGSGDALKETYGCDNSNVCANAAMKGNCFNMTGSTSSTCCCNNALCNTPSRVSTFAGIPLVLFCVIGLLFVSA